MLDPIFSTLRRIEIYRARGAYRAPGAEKIGACPLPSKYTGGLELDRRNHNRSQIDTSNALPDAREARPRKGIKKICVCLDTRTLDVSERGPKCTVQLRLRRSELLPIGQRESQSQPNSRLHVELNSGVDIELGSRGSHDGVPDIAGTADSVRDIGARGTERLPRLSEERQRSPIDEDRDETIAARWCCEWRSILDRC
jgi:hypothetical protein